MRIHQILTATAVALVLTGCAKQETADESAAAADAAATAEAATTAAPATAPAAAAEEDPETVKKRRQVDFALAEEAMVNDARGQWATTAKATSSYNDAQ